MAINGDSIFENVEGPWKGNANDLPMLLAFCEEAKYAGRFGNPRPRYYNQVLGALRRAGFWTAIGDFPDRAGLDRIARTA
jgi:hypothetical protein